MNYRVIILLILVLHAPRVIYGQAVGDFQSANSGTWATAANWQTWNGTSWVVPGAAPTSASGVITILNTHTLNINANVSIDQVVINTGGTINWTLGTCTIANGAGVDLQIDGTFWDNRGVAGTSITFAAGATWQMGASGTLIRSAGNSSNNWQNSYQGGITNIPATSNWILRKTTAGQNPALSTTTPLSGSVYPNLTIENNTGTAWGLSFTGFSAFPTIKGNLDIGGAGSGAGVITLTNSNTSGANGMYVLGNMTLRSPHVYANNGTGVNLQGNLIVNGTWTYNGAGTCLIFFTGGNAQSVSGTGSFAVYGIWMSKAPVTGTVTLNRAITVDNQMLFTSGVIVTTSTNLLTLGTAASSTVTSPTTNDSYVSGPIQKINTSLGFTFPVGKNGNYQPLSVDASAVSGGPFWTENFGTSVGCNTQNQLVSAYIGTNGAWTLTNTGVNGGAANEFFVSSTEAGMGVGVCGDGCLANAALNNQTLHVGNVFNSPIACFFCPTGDCGAAYDATPIGSGFGLCSPEDSPIADKRAESPTIDCSSKTNITLSFNYLEGGEGINDNATVWYFDGASWFFLADMNKTTVCGGGAGLWTAFTINLPASANNNANVKIGFRWINNENNVGSDPSFAVDDIVMAEVVTETFTCEYFIGNPVSTFGSAREITIDDIVVNEYWILDRNAGTASKNVTLNWDNSSNVVDMPNTKVVRWDGAIWRDHFNGSTTGVASNDVTCVAQASCGTIVTGLIASSFSPFTFGIPSATLPIELIDFTALYTGVAVDLKWVTESESNNDFFTVERSDNGIDFYEITNVDGAGNSSSTLEYSTSDKKNLKGKIYYRLKQTDFNGSFGYSEVRLVDIKQENSLEIITAFANEDLISFYCSSETENTISLSITDMSGRIVHSENVKCGFRIDIPKKDISAGVYMITIQDGMNQDVKKLVIH